MTWLWWTWLSFEATNGDVWVAHGEEQAVVWAPGALPARVDAVFDPSELTLDLDGDDICWRLVSDGQTWTGRSHHVAR